MPIRSTLLAIAAFALVPWPATAQVSSPAPVDEEREAPPPEPPARRPGAETPPRAKEPQRPPAARTEAVPDEGPRPGSEAPPDPSTAGAPDRIPPPAEPRPPAAPPLPAARPILPVTTSVEELYRHWAERRVALREADPARAAAAATAVLAARRELAIENLVPFAFSEVRETNRTLDAGLVSEALAHGELAVQLAPSLADAHLAVARARFARSPGDVVPVLSALRDAVSAALGEPHTRNAFIADVFAALFAAVLAAAAVTLTVLLLRSLRLFLHDFHHLPLLRGSASIQAGFLGLVLLAAPLAFGLGPLAFVAVALVATWLYLSSAERLALTATLALVSAAPWLAQEAARAVAWTGTLADAVHEVEHGAPDAPDLAALAELASRGGAPPQVIAALGRQAKRRGDLAAAAGWYREALRADPRAAEVEVNLGNVLFLQGDLEGAKASYLAAVDHAAGDRTIQAAAHYDLSKLYLRSSDIEKSSAARDRAEQEDGPFLRRYGADDDFSANRYLVDVPVSAAKVQALADADRAPEAIREAVRLRLTGVLPHWTWPWLPLALAAVLWLLALLETRLTPSRPCQKCGRPACRRCDGGGGPLCGQCVNVFVRKGVVEARDRFRKEAEVKRHERVEQGLTRALGVVGGGAGHLYGGHPWLGLAVLTTLLFLGFLVWFWRGVMPPPLPTPYLLTGKLAVAIPGAIVVYLIAVRDLFRRTGT